MAYTFDELAPREALVSLAKTFHQRGWMLGTAGNLSVRLNSAQMIITASGKPKGQLQNTDFLQVNIENAEIIESYAPKNIPSAETKIHQVLYQLFPEMKACLHVHSVQASLLTANMPSDIGAIRLANLEMIKGFDIWQQTPNVNLAVFENQLDVAKIADEIFHHFTLSPPDISALLIRSHGVTVWGETLQQAYNRLEIMEFILDYMVRAGHST